VNGEKKSGAKKERGARKAKDWEFNERNVRRGRLSAKEKLCEKRPCEHRRERNSWEPGGAGAGRSVFDAWCEWENLERGGVVLP